MTVSHLFLQNMVLVSLKKPTNVVFGTATIVLFIKMSLNSGVLIRGVPLSYFRGSLLEGFHCPISGGLIRRVPLSYFRGS